MGPMLSVRENNKNLRLEQRGGVRAEHVVASATRHVQAKRQERFAI